MWIIESKLSKGSAECFVLADWGRGVAHANYWAKILLLSEMVQKSSQIECMQDFFPMFSNSYLIPVKKKINILAKCIELAIETKYTLLSEPKVAPAESMK